MRQILDSRRTKTRFLSGVVVKTVKLKRRVSTLTTRSLFHWVSGDCAGGKMTKPLQRPPSCSENTSRMFTSGSSALSTRLLLNIFGHLKSLKEKVPTGKSDVFSLHIPFEKIECVTASSYRGVIYGADVSLISLVLFCSGI